jgi:hypothetical protein
MINKAPIRDLSSVQNDSLKIVMQGILSEQVSDCHAYYMREFAQALAGIPKAHTWLAVQILRLSLLKEAEATK